MHALASPRRTSASPTTTLGLRYIRRSPVASLQCRQFRRGPTQRPGHVHCVPTTRARAKQGPPDRTVPVRTISATTSAAGASARSPPANGTLCAPASASNPPETGPPMTDWPQGPREIPPGTKTPPAASPPSRPITQPTRKASMPNLLRRVPVPPEVNTLKHKICSYNNFT